MDSREQPPQPQGPQGQHQQQQHQHHHHHHHTPPPSAPSMMVGPASYPTNMSMTNANVNSAANPSSLITPNSTAHTMMSPATARFPFNSVVPQPQLPAKPSDSLNHASPYEGSSPAMRPCPAATGFSVDSAKKKRGRPRKYSPDGNIALALAPTPIASSARQGDSSGTPSTDPPPKKHRGRPAGSGKKQLDALGAGGVGFTPHVIMVSVGEDVASKIMSFSEQGPRTVCILSANGAVSNVTLRQPTTGGGTVTYEGRFEIISLTGSFVISDNNGGRRTGGLNVSLAGSDGRVLGGGVAGMLTAVSPVQVIVGSFIADGKKSKSSAGISSPSSAPASQMLNFGAPMTPATPPSQGPSSESSDDNGDVPFNRGPDLYTNPSQPLHNMPMYHHIWAGQSQQ